MSERYYGVCVEESCAACAWESANGYVRDSRTGNMMSHKHVPRRDVSLVFGNKKIVIRTDNRKVEPTTREPRQFWTLDKL